jgi:FAD/FMN-containing dehydrogenase
MGSLAQPSPTTRSKLTSSQIDELKTLLPTSTLLTPASGPAYTASVSRWSSAASKPASLCLLPTTAGEISTAVQFASEHNIDVAVKGGGHSTAGASSTEGGLLIDLGNMRGLSVDAGRKLVTAGGGATWADVDTESVKHGLCTVGGTVSDTGVGGLTLGGGYGWLSGKHGLVIDNLVECTMVLADGRVVRCSEEEEPELFWAVRGAGQNFGVAVEFTYRAFEVPRSGFWAGILMFAPEEEVLSKVVGCLNRYYTPGNPEFKGRVAGGLGLAKPPPARGNTLVLVPIIFQGTEEEGREAFKELLELGPIMSTMASVGYEVVNTILAAPIGMRVSMKGSSFQLPVRTEFFGEVLRSFDDFVEKTPDAAASMILWEFFDPTAMVTKSTGGSFANRGFHLNSMIAPFWTDEANDTVCRQWARDVAEMFKAENKKWGMATGKNGEMKGKQGAVMIYGNYDQYEEKSRDVFGDHYPRLQELKGRYDPGNLFNKLFAITPA